MYSALQLFGRHIYLIKYFSDKYRIIVKKCCRFGSSNVPPPHLHLTTSKVMATVWRLRGNIIITVLYIIILY